MKNYILACLLLMGSLVQAFAQEEKVPVTITGKVTNANDEPLVGVSIIVKDQPGLGVASNSNGEYRIETEKYQRLVFSFLGFNQKEVLILDDDVINVQLEESSDNAIDEIVVTGLGSQKKITVTGAVTTVDLSTIKTSTSSITNALAGNVAGVLAMQPSGQPGSNISEFWIRGISTFGAGTGALILVDGFERSLNEISVEDIESFSVLKDASTTAIYGSRGANGVVLITTKRGKDGKVAISAKAETAYNTRTFTPKLVDGPTYASLMNEARTTRNQTSFYSEDDLTLIRDGLDPDLFPNVDWMGMFLKDGAYTKRGSLNFNGGGSTTRYFVSGSYIDEGGMYEVDETLDNYNTNANYKRWNYRANVDLDLTKTTLVRVGVAGILGKQNLPGATHNEIWGSLMGQNPIGIPVRYSNGLMPARGSGVRNSPYTLMTQMGYIESWENKIQTNVTLEQNLNFIMEGLRFVGRFGFDTNNRNYIRRVKWPEAWEAERLRDSDGELVFRRVYTEKLMSQESSSDGDRAEFLQADLHYNKNIANHSLGAILQYSQEKKVRTQNLGTDIIQGIDRRNQRLAGRFTYGYKSRYFFDFNFGYNGSENFATGHQYDFFPAVSGAWNLGEEAFIKDNWAWVNMFKFRYSFGKVGNDYLYNQNGAQIRFPYLASFQTDAEGGYNWGDIESANTYSGLTYQNPASNLVTWEVATKHNLGLDFSLFNDRFGGALDLFHEQREGIYMQRNYIPGSIGLASNPRANVGAVLSKGFDGQLKYVQILGNTTLTFRGTLTYSKNEILEYDEQFSNYPYVGYTGFRVDQNRGLIALGLFKDYEDIRNSPVQDFRRNKAANLPADLEVMPGDIKYKDVNGDGKIDANDIVPIGATSRPNLIYGFGLSAQWKGFDANAHFQGAGKSSFFINGYTVYPFSQGNWGNILTDVVESNRWILGENEDIHATYPRLSYDDINPNNFRPSTYWLRESSYVRLKTLEIGYTLPQSLTNKWRMKGTRFFFLGTNLLTFSSFKLWDPEMNSSNGQAYPLAKTFSIGVTTNL